jgi:hypothetical protein
MKKLWKCKVAIILVAGWILLSVLGYLGKDTIYKNYSIDVKKTPYFVLVFQGIHDGIYPWSQKQTAFWERWETAAADADAKNSDANGSFPVSDAKTEDTETENMDTEDAVLSEDTASTEDTPEVTETPDTEEKDANETPADVFVDVEEDYFDDALFIGDSRTVGLHDYSGLDKATFYATVGMNVYEMWDEAFCEVDGKKITLEEALNAKQYGKIYFQIGINEMGRGTIDTFMEAYTQSVQKFMELQPDAIIYVQAIMKVTKTKSDNDPIFNNEGITARNERIAELADNERIFYIDVNEVVCDESGGLNPELTFDNLHLYGSKYGIWVDFLKTKGVE